MSFYPSYDSVKENASSEVLLTVYRSYLSIISLMVYFLLASLLVYVINAVFSDFTDYLRWLGVIPVLLFLNIFRTYYNDVAYFEQHKVTKHGGRLGFSYVMPSVKYVDIRALNVAQDIFGRIFDYGDVEVGTAGAEGYEMTIHGVRAPYELAQLFERFRDESMLKRGVDTTSTETSAAIQEDFATNKE